MISLSQAFAQWQELADTIPADDGPMLAESWNDYTDSLCEGGELSALQYHYAPAYDKAMPGEGSRYDALADDRAFILDAMGLAMRATRAYGRPGMDGWGKSASHYRVTFTRSGKRMQVFYSMGPALTGAPSVCDVFHSVLSDSVLGESDFPDFCSDIGADDDSRKAYSSWQACKRIRASLARLFSGTEQSELSELFEGM